MPVSKPAVMLARHEIATHPSVVDLGAPVFEGDGAYIKFGLRLGFGARWEAEGGSPTGVRPTEEVRLDFGPSFPSVAAKPSLRSDFSRDHPHIQPWLGLDGRVVPCVVDGSLDEFVAARGYYRLVDQLVKWLRSAAEKRLIDPAQGWEPMRRDHFSDVLIADASTLRGFVGRDAGSKLFRTTYAWKRTDPAEIGTYYGELGEPTTAKLATVESSTDDSGHGIGLGLAVAVWAGRAPGGGSVICDKYVPEQVSDLRGLMERADELRLGEPLRAALALIRHHAKNHESTPKTFPLPIVLMVRRPMKLIGTDSDIELCPYVVPFSPAAPVTANPPVAALAHSDAISIALLRRMSGEPPAETWALVGCGSLGSKIALHRTRAGAAPLACGDKSSLLAHNAARHALYPQRRMLQLGWAGSKATELAAVIQDLGQTTAVIEGNHGKLVASFGEETGPTPSWLVNTTASTVVREDLARMTKADMPRVVEACLFNRARLGYVSTEGQGRNPDTAELLGEFYEIARSEVGVGSKLYASEGQVGTVAVGQGCASVTMTVSDAEISAMAAPMSEVVAGLSSDQTAGRIDLFAREGLGLSYQAYNVSPWRRMPLEGLAGWSLSVSERAHAAMVADIAGHRKTETGGVLVGWVSMIARRIYVTNVVEAPADSVRSASEFVLGTAGLRDRLEGLWNDTAGAVVCVGTWHSHLGAATPSTRDKLSAAVVGLVEPRPMAFLIHGTDGLRAISAASPAAMKTEAA